MISAQAAIVKARRGITLSAILRWVMISVAVLAFLFQPLLDGTGITGTGVLLVIGALWLILSFRSFTGSRKAADSSSLIAAGQYEAAEQNIAEAIDSFSIFRTVKLMSLHHLAVLRHAQNRWQDTALLCRAVLTQRLGNTLGGLDRSSRLLLAESLLELGDLPGVYDNLRRLYDQRLSLREALTLLVIQTDYLARTAAWGQMLEGAMTKVQLCELLPTLHSARTQAFLSLAAKNAGKNELCEWLKKRVELLCDVQRLCKERPMLWEVWKKE
ncbi:MAG TPA: hypothetical protein VG742_01925 [Dongiaceae bacterium]|nr:hypothetical protein [Dongiaceae bacterium]